MRLNTLALLGASTIILAHASLPASQGRPRVLVALLAHADDESAAGPVLARYAREGVQIFLVIASNGSAGSGSSGGYLIRSDSGPVGDSLVKVRAEEARCAATALGIQPPILLGFPDGKLGDYPGDRTLMYRLTERIAKEIERLRPDVVITWGPEGGTGHPDHRLVSNIATQLLQHGAPGMPDRLFHMYLPAESFRALNPQRGEPALLLPQAKYFTVHVPFTPADFEAAKKSVACHRSQLTPEALQRLLPVMERVANGRIAFIPAGTKTSSDDLFR